MWESPIEVIQSEIRTKFEDNCLKAVQSYGFLVDKTELARALTYDRKQYEKGYAEAMEDLDILILEFLVPMQIENVCEELSDWGMDEDCETWCSRNCGVTNDGKCPAMNCYKEWIRMKKGSEENAVD